MSPAKKRNSFKSFTPFFSSQKRRLLILQSFADDFTQSNQIKSNHI